MTGGRLWERGLSVAEGRRFEDLLAELESVTDRLASGDVGIEEAADLYERAEHLHREAAERLEAVRARVERLRQAPEVGDPG